MTTTLPHPRALRRSDAAPPVRLHVDRTRQLRLLPSADGWSLVSLDGELVFSALGLSGRRQCLEYAQTEGVVALTS